MNIELEKKTLQEAREAMKYLDNPVSSEYERTVNNCLDAFENFLNISKPLWKDAPYWANYLAQDGDGYWHWYETKPVAVNGCDWFDSMDEGRSQRVERSDLNWKDTLEQRPEKGEIQ